MPGRIKQFHPGDWQINPDYGKENVYRLWNGKDSNYQTDTSPERMDANARLMQQAPKLYDIATRVLGNLRANELKTLPLLLIQDIERAIAQVQGKS